MRRVFLAGVSALLLFAASGVEAQRRGAIELRGTPASVTSPALDGRLRGIPGSVTDPVFRGIGQPTLNSCCRHGSRRFHTSVSAVPYYPYYGVPYGYDTSYYSQPEAVQQQAPPPQIIIIKDERSSSADEPRYGEHDFETNEATSRPATRPQNTPAPASPAADEQLPLTTLVYRDGHKAEVRNYAIVGANLIDLTKSSLLKKIPLTSLDLEATRRENEDNGVDFHLP